MKEEKHPEGVKKPNLFVRILALAMTAFLVLGALFLVVNRDRYNLDAVKRWLAYRALSSSETGEGESFPYAGGERQSVAWLENGVLFASDSGAHYYSLSGELRAEEVTSLTNPVLSASRKAGVVYDAGGKDLHLYKGAEEAFSLTLPGGGDLLSARVNDAGWLAVTAQESGYKGAVTVYDDTGEKVIRISLSSTFAVDAILSPDNRTVAVITIGQEAGAFRSDLLLYPTNDTEPIARVPLGNTTVLDLDFERDALWVLGERSLTVLSPKGEDPRVFSFGHSYLKGCDFGGDGFALLLLGHYRAGAASRAVTIGADGAVMAQANPKAQVLDFDAAGSYCSLLTGDSLTIYHPDLTPSAALDHTQQARYTALSPSGSALLANQQEAWVFIPN